MINQEFKEFSNNIKQLTEIDLSLYKEKQMDRRLTSLRNKLGFTTYTEFYLGLCKDQHLLQLFLDYLTINVSEFFRNAEIWRVFEEEIISKSNIDNQRLKIWSAACSKGEEPYTIALILSKHLPLANINILATDINEKVLEYAKIGKYSKQTLHEVPESMLQKYFRQVGEHYVICPELKNTVSFKLLNLLADPFENHFDIVFCRNVLIYFSNEAKELIYQKLHHALKPNGILIIGNTENIIHYEKYGFELNDNHFYSKILSHL